MDRLRDIYPARPNLSTFLDSVFSHLSGRAPALAAQNCYGLRLFGLSPQHIRPMARKPAVWGMLMPSLVRRLTSDTGTSECIRGQDGVVNPQDTFTVTPTEKLAAIAKDFLLAATLRKIPPSIGSRETMQLGACALSTIRSNRGNAGRRWALLNAWAWAGHWLIPDRSRENLSGAKFAKDSSQPQVRWQTLSGPTAALQSAFSYVDVPRVHEVSTEEEGLGCEGFKPAIEIRWHGGALPELGVRRPFQVSRRRALEVAGQTLGDLWRLRPASATALTLQACQFRGFDIRHNRRFHGVPDMDRILTCWLVHTSEVFRGVGQNQELSKAGQQEVLDGIGRSEQVELLLGWRAVNAIIRQRDQESALRWVNAHITKFGGSPSKVTIWGESAGADSVLQHVIANAGQTEP
ncbi:hypothetical protein DFH09DRAFT_1096210 [Mycena vulgaris]|nr:hypothetical protein DFH09DRAFT_1096210 [Mycena vulgaris]